MRKSIFIFLALTFLTVGLKAQFKNIKLTDLSESKYPLTGPGIAVNQKNPDNIIAGISPDRAFYTYDGGKTWSESQLTSPNGVAGNPALISDLRGHVYFFHRSDPGSQGVNSDGWLDRISFHKTSDGGKTWEEGEPVGLNPPKDQDRPQLATHPKRPDIYVTWTEFDKYGQADTSFHSSAMFSMSTSGGKKWSKPVQLSTYGDCKDDGNTPAGAMSAVDMEGRAFASWSIKGMLYMDRSYSGGDIWLSNDIPLTKQPGGWAMNVPGLGRTSGKPMMMIDNSTSAYHNLIYVMWADQRKGADDTDIWMMRSTNRGDNWTEPLKVNQDSSKHHQFLPHMAIDQSTGYIYVIYYDRRDHTDNQTDVYMSYSSDGGNHYTDVKINETPFTPVEGKFLTDYISISAHKGVITPIWVQTDGSVNSVWTSIIKQDELTISRPKAHTVKKTR